MSQKIYTFAVSNIDTKNKELVEELKKHCRLTGKTFTHVCLQALKEYAVKENINVKR